MSEVIWKHELAIAEDQTILLPEGYEILCVQMQSGFLCLWEKHNAGAKKTEARRFMIYGTGHLIGVPLGLLRYIGTVQQHQFVDEHVTTLVWHVFENAMLHDVTE